MGKLQFTILFLLAAAGMYALIEVEWRRYKNEQAQTEIMTQQAQAAAVDRIVSMHIETMKVDAMLQQTKVMEAGVIAMMLDKLQKDAPFPPPTTQQFAER